MILDVDHWGRVHKSDRDVYIATRSGLLLKMYVMLMICIGTTFPALPMQSGMPHFSFSIFMHGSFTKIV